VIFPRRVQTFPFCYEKLQLLGDLKGKYSHEKEKETLTKKDKQTKKARISRTKAKARKVLLQTTNL